MSAFLGPIHHWLFHKIKIQEELVEQLIANAEQSDKLKQTAAQQAGSLPEGELQDIIEEGNIHGWLQQQVNIVETRLAYVVSQMMKDKSQNLTVIEEVARQQGHRNSELNAEATVSQCFKLLQDTLVDGMPCDHVNQIITQEENLLVWKRTKRIHDEFWMQWDCDPQQYDRIRNAFIEGVLTDTKIRYTVIEDGVYQLERMV